MKKHFKLIVKTALISVYVIFLAGSIVRMTGSGMGCPDWPKCFGYYIPPTDEAQLRWKANTFYDEGTLIVLDETLYSANSDLQTESKWNSTNWSPYTKHEYAIFNVYHTWTEYINRLASVVSGLIFLFLIATSLKFWKEKKENYIPLIRSIFYDDFRSLAGKNCCRFCLGTMDHHGSYACRTAHHRRASANLSMDISRRKKSHQI